MTPYYQDEWATLYCDDAAEVLPLLEITADLLITDPPYGANYRSNRRTMRFEFIEGDEDASGVPEIVGSALKLLRRARHVYVFGPNVLAGLPVASVTELVWDKGIRSGGDLALPWGKSHESVHFGVYEISKANRAKGQGGVAARLRKNSVLRYQRTQAAAVTKHPTEKPVALLRDLIESSSVIGELVLDPFAGVGSTLVAATLEGRRSVGVEIDEGYCAVAADRLKKASAVTRVAA